MKKILLFSLFLSSCTAHTFSEKYSGELTQMKQDIVKAKKTLERQQAYVDNLEDKLARHEINLIKKEIRDMDKKEIAKELLTPEQWSAFFFPQREILSQIIHDKPGCRAEAQELLDQILTLITQLSDSMQFLE